MKQIDLLKRSLEETHRNVKDNAQTAANLNKSLADSLTLQLNQFRGTFDEYKEQMAQSFKDIDTSIMQNQKLLLDKDAQRGDQIDVVKKSLRTVTGEVDDLRKQLDGFTIIFRRIDAIETKTHDLWELIESVKKGSQAEVNENVITELKNVSNSVFQIKNTLNKRIDELKEDTTLQFERNSVEKLEEKINEKINDVVQALTRQCADRLDTKKNLRVIEKQLKNVFDVVTFMLNNPSASATGYPVPQKLLEDVGKHSMLYSSNALASHVLSFNQEVKANKSEAEI